MSGFGQGSVSLHRGDNGALALGGEQVDNEQLLRPTARHQREDAFDPGGLAGGREREVPLPPRDHPEVRADRGPLFGAGAGGEGAAAAGGHLRPADRGQDGGGLLSPAQRLGQGHRPDLHPGPDLPHGGHPRRSLPVPVQLSLHSPLLRSLLFLQPRPLSALASSLSLSRRAHLTQSLLYRSLLLKSASCRTHISHQQTIQKTHLLVRHSAITHQSTRPSAQTSS